MGVLIRSLFFVSAACAAFVVFPGVAAAQPKVFVDGVFELATALEGTFGDEGARIAPALDRIGNALAEWDRTIRAFEDRVASASTSRSAREAVDLRMMLARIYAERGRFADAMRQLDAARGLEPGRSDVLVLRGLVLEADSKSIEADESFRSAWTIEPRDPVTAYYAVRHSATTRTPQDVERARDLMTVAYQKILKQSTRPTDSPFGILHLQQKPADAASRNDVDAAPVLPLAKYAKGYARLVARDYDGALAELRAAAANDPLVTDPSARSAPIMRAVAALREGRLAEARSLFDEANPRLDSSEAHRILGLIYWASSDYDRSVEQFTTAIDRDPRDERSRLARARVLSVSGRDVDAQRALLETIQASPDSALAHWSLGLIYERLNRHADARREIEYATAGAVVGRADLYTAIGRLAGSATDVPAAIDAFMRAIDENPNNPVTHKYLAGALLQQDLVDDALIEFVAALLIDPLDADAHAGIGRIHLDGGRHADAADALRRAVEVAPDHVEARYALATALTRLGKTQDAAREFDRVEEAQRRAFAERRRSMSLDVLKEEAALRAAEGQYERAIELYEKAATLASDSAVYRELAGLYAKLGRIDDAARARAMSEKVGR
jgi:tetratricopeptide (TPR) repeat protein